MLQVDDISSPFDGSSNVTIDGHSVYLAEYLHDDILERVTISLDNSVDGSPATLSGVHLNVSYCSYMWPDGRSFSYSLPCSVGGGWFQLNEKWLS